MRRLAEMRRTRPAAAFAADDEMLVG